MKFPRNTILQILFYLFMVIGVFTTIICTIIGLTFIFQKTDSDLKEFSSKFSYKGNIIVYSKYYKKNSNPPNIDSVKNLFTNNSNNSYILDSITNDSINLSFEKPVYISKIVLFENNENKSSKFSRPNKIIINVSGKENEFFSDVINYSIPENEKIHNISFRETPGFCSIFRIKNLQININQENEQNIKQKRIILNRIEIFFDDKPYLKPTISLDEIKSRFVKGKKNWNIASSVKFHTLRQLEVEDNLIYEVLLNLSYYSLLGDQEAENILKNYSPGGAHEGEYSSSVISWYDLTKEYNNK